MKTREALLDVALATAANYVGTNAMEPVRMKLYEIESAADRDPQDAVRPVPPYRIAAEKITRSLGLDLNDEQLDRLGIVFHYGLPAQWAPLYPVLRRTTRLSPPAAGLATGATMSICRGRTDDSRVRVLRAEPGSTHSARTLAASSPTWSSGWP